MDPENAEILKLLREIKAILVTGARFAPTPTSPTKSQSVKIEPASDADLDSEYGNPLISYKTAPPAWKGPDMNGKRLSEAPSDFLEAWASRLQWQGEQDDKAGAVDSKGRPKGNWKRMDAARALGWAARNREQKAIAPEQAALAEDW